MFDLTLLIADKSPATLMYMSTAQNKTEAQYCLAALDEIDVVPFFLGCIGFQYNSKLRHLLEVREKVR